MLRRFHISAAVLVLSATITAWGQVAIPRPQVAAADIVEAMRKGGIAIRPRQVVMLSDIPVRTEHTPLQAMRIEPQANESSRVLMRCVDRGSCIPFYVLVSGLNRNEQIAGPGMNVPKVRLEKAVGPLVEKRGSRAMLEIVAPEMIIRIPVICLQSGRQGERIKASSPDQKSTYMGEIISPGLLRGAL